MWSKHPLDSVFEKAHHPMFALVTRPDCKLLHWPDLMASETFRSISVRKAGSGSYHLGSPHAAAHGTVGSGAR